MSDLILKGGRVIDESQGRNGQHDLAIERRTFARIAPTIPVKRRAA